MPFKTGLAIVADRTTPFEPSRQLVLDNIAHLDQVPAAAAAACALHVEYVYYGAKNTSWKPRSFPPPDVLRASAALQEVFAAGDAAIFRIRVGQCPG